MRHNLVTGHPIEPPWPQGTEFIMFGMGCFWGAERIFWQIDGVWTTFAAYAGGHQPDPTYGQVCTGLTGHAETVGVVYDPDRVDVLHLLAEFWEQHDPTQGMRQGNDVGPQYRSVILTTTDAQIDNALRSRDQYQAALGDAGYGEITTEIHPLTTWYVAEEEHQQYLAKWPNGYCNHGFCQVTFPNPPAFDLQAPLPGAAGQ